MGLLDNKAGLVTGGGGGIGRAICEAYAREGAKVLVSDFNAETGQETVEIIKAAGGEAVFCAADVSKEDAVKAMVQAAVDNFGRLDIACNSAALSRGSGPIHEFSRETFDQTLEMCLTNTWLCLKYEVETMLTSGGGSIVNISSNASLNGQAFNTAYAAAKSGVNILTKSASMEYGGQGIRINAVSPGVILTPGLEQYMKDEPEIGEGLKKRSILGRLGKPEEIAEAVVFFCSDRASYINGQLISVDGGRALA